MIVPNLPVRSCFIMPDLSVETTGLKYNMTVTKCLDTRVIHNSI